MVLQDKVNVLWGTDGSNLQKIINETANKYKVIAINTASLSDDLQDATNFSRYAFQTSMSADQLGRGLAYYYGQTRRRRRSSTSCARIIRSATCSPRGSRRGSRSSIPMRRSSARTTTSSS
jgi:hypothetical protein